MNTSFEIRVSCQDDDLLSLLKKPPIQSPILKHSPLPAFIVFDPVLLATTLWYPWYGALLVSLSLLLTLLLKVTARFEPGNTPMLFELLSLRLRVVVVVIVASLAAPAAKCDMLRLMLDTARLFLLLLLRLLLLVLLW